MIKKGPSNLNVRLYVNTFVLALIIMHSLLLRYVLGIDWPNAIVDAAVTYLSLYQLAFATHIFFNSKQSNYTQIFLIIIQSILLTLAWIYLYSWLIEYIYQRWDENYLRFWRDAKFVRSVVAWVVLCNLMVILYLSQNLSDEAAEQERTSYNEQLKKDAELLKLRQQINPHFLFNTLNSINALIGIAPDKAKRMIEQMSVYFRNSLKKEENNWTTLKEELDDIHIYFEIEKVRFGHRLEIEENVKDECLNIKIPPFLLQPLVENAIKYGLYGTVGKSFIRMNMECNLDTAPRVLTFTIINSFDNTAIQPKGTGFGLNYIRRRLFLLFGNNDLLKTEIKPLQSAENENINASFTATLYIPITSQSQSL